MNLKKFKGLDKQFSVFPLTGEQMESKEYQDYSRAIDTDKDCIEWWLARQVREAGLRPQSYCCLKMAYHLIEDKKAQATSEINYDCVITKSGKNYGLPIHDGGSSYILINHCPWCGVRLG